MSDIKYEELKKGDPVVFARVLPKIGYYELLDLHIGSVYENYCTGVDPKTKQTYSFGREQAGNVLFSDRKLALVYLKDKKEENKDVRVATE